MNRLIGIGLCFLLAAGACAREEEKAMTKCYMESTLAGAWYNADPARLKAELDGYLQQADVDADPSLWGVLLPHAGYAYSGPCAAVGAKALAAVPDVRRVVVLGFTHRIRMPDQISLPANETHYRSPLGETPLDTAAIAALLEQPLFADVPATRRGENSVEMLLPLLQAALAGREWSLVPLTLGQLDDETRDQAAAVLKPLLEDGHTVLVASTDFTHYGPNFGYVPFRDNVEENLRKLDGGAIEKILAGDAAGFAAYCAQTGATICGQDTIGIMLRMLPQPFRARQLAYDTSGRSTGDFENSVSYAALAFYRGETVEKEEEPSADSALSAADREALLKLARRTLERAFKEKHPPPLEDMDVEATPAMNRIMGGFVTLTIDGNLRGCIGEIFPRRPLVEVVRDHALDAAFNDPRFPPLTAAELPRVRIEISALTPPEPVGSYNDIEIGRHGMVLQVGRRSAVFLPQVAPEQGWDLATTLSHLAMKAGLRADAWKEPEAKFTVFEAVVFHE